jgi:hypothetical protein
MTDVRRVARRLFITAVVLAVAVPVAALATVAVWFSVVSRPFDVAEAARAPEVTNAHRITAALVDDRLNSAVAAGPAVSARATSVRDGCEDNGSAFFGERGSLGCTRTVVRYLGVNGDLGTLQRTWEKRLTAAGWRRDRTHSTGDPRGLAYLSGPDDRLPVRIMWNERPSPPEVIGEPGSGEVKFDDQPVDRIATYRQAYARYRYVVAVSMTVYYWPASPVPSPIPSESPGNAPHCFNGHDCPGG